MNRACEGPKFISFEGGVGSKGEHHVVSELGFAAMAIAVRGAYALRNAFDGGSSWVCI